MEGHYFKQFEEKDTLAKRKRWGYFVSCCKPSKCLIDLTLCIEISNHKIYSFTMER